MRSDKKILVLEDSSFFRDWLKDEILKADSSIDIEFATSLREAKHALKNESPDLAVLDISLPDGNGIEILKNIKFEHPEMKTIIFTNLPFFKKECITIGADYFYDKSQDFDVISSTISSILNSKSVEIGI
jgi:DNA-binding NarL/FixJ family response regulator